MNTIYVYADWLGLDGPQFVGELRASMIRGGEHFSFSYHPGWLESEHALTIDPELMLYRGDQHPSEPRNFRSFLDSSPDRWGRLLMRRREALRAHAEARKPRQLFESDYLLGVHDQHRLGALRFKLDQDGAFLDDDEVYTAPPLARLRELEAAALTIESSSDYEDAAYQQQLALLLAPGSSLGGARPKASVVDEQGELWIAKFPSREDDHDVGAWEYVVARLAERANISVPETRLMQLGHRHHTFLSKRFDRTSHARQHFSSAMTQLGYDDGADSASYLELAEFITHHGAQSASDLEALWRRIVFNITVSNTDDHLRNHGFLYTPHGWCLAPAYDVNPNPSGTGLHLSISDTDNRLDRDLAMSTIGFYRISPARADQIWEEVVDAVANWQDDARSVGISRSEIQAMQGAFVV